MEGHGDSKEDPGKGNLKKWVKTSRDMGWRTLTRVWGRRIRQL